MSSHRLSRLVRKIPLVSGLPDCTIADHRDAAIEFFLTLVWSTLPIWLGTLVVYVLKNAPANTWSGALYSNIGSGELFLYSTSALAPVFYMALHDKPGVGEFPSKKIHIAIVSVIMVICGAFFALLRANIELREQLLFHFSTYMYPAALILLYLATVYHHARHGNPAAEMRSQEERFSDRFQRRQRRGEG